MNYTLQQLKIESTNSSNNREKTAYCAAWIYTAEDCVMTMMMMNHNILHMNDRELSERIFNDVGNIDYIYQVIQECVDEVN